MVYLSHISLCMYKFEIYVSKYKKETVIEPINTQYALEYLKLKVFYYQYWWYSVSAKWDQLSSKYIYQFMLPCTSWTAKIEIWQIQQMRFTDARKPSVYIKRLKSIILLNMHSVIQGQFPLRQNLKCLIPPQNDFSPGIFKSDSLPTHHFCVDFHSNLQTSKYDARA